jgi:hypothetical protein
MAWARENALPPKCARSVYLDLAVGQPPGHIGQQIPIRPPHIADAATHRAEPIYLCRVVCKRCARHKSAAEYNCTERLAQVIGVSLERALKVGLKPHDN